MLFCRVYVVYGIRSSFKGYSPGGATVLLCLICDVMGRAKDRGQGEVVVGAC